MSKIRVNGQQTEVRSVKVDVEDRDILLALSKKLLNKDVISYSNPYFISTTKGVWATMDCRGDYDYFDAPTEEERKLYEALMVIKKALGVLG